MRVRQRKALVALVGLAVVVAFASSSPAHADGGQPTSESTTGLHRIKGVQTGHKIKDFSGWTVEYWGPGYSSGPLDASIPANRDKNNFFPATIEFKCTFFRGSTILNSSGELEAGTEQTCSGSFLEQFTTAQFQRRAVLGYWVNYSGVGESQHTANDVQDWTWTIGCNASGGTYSYRLKAVGWARADDGTLLHTKVGYGPSGRYTCGA